MAMFIKYRGAIVLGLALVALACAYLYPRYFSPLARAGKRYGYNSPTYVAVVDLQEHATQHTQLDEEDLGQLLQLSNDANPFIRVKALTALLQTRGTKQAVIAARIARRKLTDGHPLVRTYALNVLSRIMAPDAIQLARKMLNDPDEGVRKEARRIVGP